MKLFVLTLLFILSSCVEEIDPEEIANETFAAAGVQFCVNNECKPTNDLVVEFKDSTISSVEGSKAIVTIVSSKAVSKDTMVSLSVESGSSLTASEYSIASLNMMIPEGSNTASMEIIFPTDNIVEPTKTLNLRLSFVGEGLIGNRSRTSISVADGVPPVPIAKPNVGFSFNSYDITEGAKNVIVPISLSQISSRDIVLNFNSNRSSEILIKPEILVIPAGTLSKEIVIDFNDNEVVDGNRDLLLTMTSNEANVDGVKNKALFKIVDNDMEKPPVVVGNPPGQKNGLFAEYWNNISLSGTPVKSEVVPLVNNNFGSGGATTGINPDDFSIRYTGQIFIQNPGSYTFHVEADDGVRLWIDDQLLVDKFIDQGPTRYSATVMFASQSSHKVKIEYYENGGGAVVRFLWTQNNQVVPVPNDVLYATNEAVVFEELSFLSPINMDKVQSEFDLSLSCFNNIQVRISGDISAPITKTCQNNQLKEKVQLIQNGEESKKLIIEQTVDGQVVKKKIMVSLDNNKPSLIVESPSQYEKVSQLVTITGKCETDLALSITGVGIKYPLKSVCTFGSFNKTVSLTDGDGLKSIIIDQQDDAGNKSEHTLIVENKNVVVVDGGSGSGGGSGTNVSFTQAKAVLDTHCISCHRSGGSAANWNFDYNNEEDFVKNNYVVPGDPVVSKLIQRSLFSAGQNANMPLGTQQSLYRMSDYQILYDWVASMGKVELKIEPFTVNNNIHRLLGFNERLSKLEYLFGSTAFNKVRNNFLSERYELGDFNYAQGVKPNLDWTSSRIIIWQELLEPICQDTSVIGEFSSEAGMLKFVEKAYGRKIETTERNMITELNSSGLDSKSRFGVLCLAIASSGEFVSK